MYENKDLRKLDSDLRTLNRIKRTKREYAKKNKGPNGRPTIGQSIGRIIRELIVSIIISFLICSFVNWSAGMEIGIRGYIIGGVLIFISTNLHEARVWNDYGDL